MNINWILDKRSKARLKKNKAALFGLLVISLSFLIVLGGYYIRPDGSPYANRQDLSLAIEKPGFSIEMMKILRQNAISQPDNIFLNHFIGKPDKFQWIAITEYAVENQEINAVKYSESNEGRKIQLDLPTALFKKERILEKNDQGVMVKETDGTKFWTNEEMKAKFLDEQVTFRKFWLGTDRYGRDMLSRMMAGTTISLSVGFIAVSISLIVGLLLGSLAGYFRGRLDALIMWFINVIWSIPTLLLVIAISLVLGKGYWQVFVAVGLTMWVEVARVVRGQILGIREKEYITAGTALGYSHMRIIVKHILPNAISPVIVISSANFASAILIEAGLSFLGISAAPPQASWGRMIADHKGFIITGDAFLAMIPGIAIVILVLSFMLLGNGLRDAMDTRSGS